MSERLLVGVPEAGEMIGHSRSYIYELIAAGKLDARKSGHRTLLTVESLRKYAESLPRVNPSLSAPV